MADQADSRFSIAAGASMQSLSGSTYLTRWCFRHRPSRLRPCQKKSIKIYVKSLGLAHLFHPCLVPQNSSFSGAHTRRIERPLTNSRACCVACACPFARPCWRATLRTRLRTELRLSTLCPHGTRAAACFVARAIVFKLFRWFELEELMFDLLSCVRVSARASARTLGADHIRRA